MRSVALDYGRKIAMCEVLNGQVVARATVTDFSKLERWIGPNTPPAKVAVECCVEAWWVERKLRAWGHEPLLVDTTRVRKLGIAQHRRKTDRIDAEVLARAVEQGLIPRAHVLSQERQILRMHLNVRRALVEMRAQLITTARALIRAHGKNVGDTAPDRFAALVAEAPLGEEVRALIAPLTEMMEAANKQLVGMNARLESLSEREPIIAKLKTTPGIGAVVAGAYVAVVDDPNRFRNAHQVESYFGLAPSEETSGKRRVGAISKQGNSYARALLVQAAWAIWRMRDKDDPLRCWVHAVAERRGKRVAIVALARRLVGILWALWRDDTVYDARQLAKDSAHGLARQSQTVAMKAISMRRAGKKRFGRPVGSTAA